VITIRQFVLGSGMMATPTPLILRSTVTQNYSQSSSPLISPFERSLQEHCEKILASGRSRELIVQLEVKFEGICPATHERTVLRVADELVSNGIEHGFSGRQRGHVFVHIVSRAGVGVRVSVSDDGCGFDSGPIIDGNGFHLLRQIGDLYAGAAVEAPFAANTAITVVIPLQRQVPFAPLPRGFVA
jgi:two-component sensor histidine kinase